MNERPTVQEAALRATVHLLCQESSRSVLLTIGPVCALVPPNPYPLPSREEIENKPVGSASRKWRKYGGYRLFALIRIRCGAVSLDSK